MRLWHDTLVRQVACSLAITAFLSSSSLAAQPAQPQPADTQPAGTDTPAAGDKPSGTDTPPANDKPSDADTARELYVSGHEAARVGRWADALKRFEASFSLAPNAATLFNIAVAMRSLGRHKEARNAFDRLLQSYGAELDEPTRTQAKTLRAEEAARLAVVRVTTFVPCMLRIDGALSSDRGVAERVVEVDAGRRAFSVECPKRKPMTRELKVAEGARTQLTLKPPLLKPIVVTRVTPARSPVPWVLVGVGGAAALAGAILFGVSFADRAAVEGAPDGTPWSDVASANDRAELFSALGPALFGVGAASAASGLVWMSLDNPGAPSVGLRWRARF